MSFNSKPTVETSSAQTSAAPFLFMLPGAIRPAANDNAIPANDSLNVANDNGNLESFLSDNISAANILARIFAVAANTNRF